MYLQQTISLFFKFTFHEEYTGRNPERPCVIDTALV